MLRFHLLPTEHRVVVTHDAVRAATGNYYVRAYGKGDDTHAKASDGKYPFGVWPTASSSRLVRHFDLVFPVCLSPRALSSSPCVRLDPADNDLFCAITEKYVNSSLNHFNLQTECVTYT